MWVPRGVERHSCLSSLHFSAFSKSVLYFDDNSQKDDLLRRKASWVRATLQTSGAQRRDHRSHSAACSSQDPPGLHDQSPTGPHHLSEQKDTSKDGQKANSSDFSRNKITYSNNSWAREEPTGETENNSNWTICPNWLQTKVHIEKA